MSQHPLKAVLNAYKRQKTAKPDGSYAIEEAAKQWGVSLENARRTLTEMKQAGIVQEIKGSRVTAAGQIQPCIYYRPTKAKA